jgi:hypothetical protein
MAKLQDLKAENFAFFQGLPEDIRDKMVKSVEYIQQLASMSQTSIADWDLTDVFKPEHGEYPLLVDKKSINKKFFAYEAQVKTEGEDALLPAKVRKTLTETVSDRIKKRKQAQVQNYQNNIDSYFRNIENYETHIRHQWTEVRKAQELIAMYTGTGPLPITEELLKIAKHPFWEYKSSDSSHIHFLTRNPVVLSEVNKKAGLDIRVPLGLFRASIAYDSWTVTVHQHKDNVTSNGHPHCYISNQGSVCWGTAQGTASQFQKEGKLADMMDLLASLLTTFAPDSHPYVRLADLKIRYDQMEAQKAEAAREERERQAKIAAGEICGECNSTEIKFDNRHYAHCSQWKRTNKTCNECGCWITTTHSPNCRFSEKTADDMRADTRLFFEDRYSMNEDGVIPANEARKARRAAEAPAAAPTTGFADPFATDQTVTF